MVMGDLVREVDVAVVGGGPGGYSAAFRCAELGLETVVVDAGRGLGGTCLWEGCIPSKALLHVAAGIGQARRLRDLGVEFGEPRISLDPLRKWKDERVVGRLARGLAGLARSKGVEVVAGRAVFEEPGRLRVEGEAPQKIVFKHAIVATGAVDVGLPGLEPGRERVLGPAAALELAEVPERLLVLGGGYIGLELAQLYAALGSAVTLVEPSGVLLPEADRDLVQPLQRSCEKLLAAVHLGAAVAGAGERAGGVEVTVGDRRLAFDRVVVATGRRPRTAGLGLDVTAVRVDGHGAIAVDERCRTADPRIYAAGDVTGEPMLAHRAMRQGKVAAEAIAGRPAAFDSVAVPAVVFTDPEVAWCGLTETQAGPAGRAVRVARVSWAASGRALTLGRSDGLTKLVVDAGSGRVLGAGVVGPGAGELIAEAALALESAVTAEDLALTIHAHPTLAETLMDAAESLLRG